MSFTDFSSENIGLKGKYVFINRLESHGELGVVLKHIGRHFHNPQTKRLSVRVAPQGPYFPNLIVPLAATLDSLKASGKTVTLQTEAAHIKEMGLVDPLSGSKQNFESSSRLLDKIWRIENEFHLRNAAFYMHRFLGDKVGFDTELLKVLHLAIVEALENALIHSEAGCCFFMGQIHSKRDYFSLCISDGGMGVRESLRRGGYVYSNELECLAASIKKGVTSKHHENRGGNGLYCLSRLAKINKGQFGLWSGTSSIVVDGKQHNDRTYEYLPSIDLLAPSTHVDFQIPLTHNVTADYDELPYDEAEMSAIVSSDDGFRVLFIADLEAGYCTRHAGSVARDIAKRFLDDPGTAGLTLDFRGIPICSASYLDSFVGVLAKQMGSEEFRSRFRIHNATIEIRKAIFSTIRTR